MEARLWNFTALDILERCEEEFVRRYVQGLEPTYPEASKLFGAAVHVGRAALYAGDAPAAAADQAALSWDAALGAEVERDAARALLLPVANVLGAGLVGRAASGGRMLVSKPHLTEAYLRKIVEMYAGLRAPLERALLNETRIEWPEEGFHGKVDGAFERNGGIEVEDLKTTGLYIGDKWAAQWGHHLQPAGYLDLAAYALGRLETLTETGIFWVEGIHLDRRGYPKVEDFHRYRHEYHPGIRAELRGVRRRLQERASYLAEHPEAALKKPRSCFRYNELCPFHGPCWAEPEEREALYELGVRSGRFERRDGNDHQ